MATAGMRKIIQSKYVLVYYQNISNGPKSTNEWHLNILWFFTLYFLHRFINLLDSGYKFVSTKRDYFFNPYKTCWCHTELVGWGRPWALARVLIYGRVCHIARITRPTCFYKFHFITSAQFKHTFLFLRVLRAGALFACAVLMYFSVNQTLCVCICWLLTVYVFSSTDSFSLSRSVGDTFCSSAKYTTPLIAIDTFHIWKRQCAKIGIRQRAVCNNKVFFIMYWANCTLNRMLKTNYCWIPLLWANR